MTETETPTADGTQPGKQADAAEDKEASGIKAALAAERAKKRELEAKLATIEAERKQAAEKQLQEQGQWQSLAEQRAKEANDAKALAESYKAQQEAILKRAEIRAKLHDIAKPEYLKLVPIDSLKVDGESVTDPEDALSQFRKEHPELFRASNGAGNPGALHPATAGKTVPDKEISAMTPQERKAHFFDQLKRSVGG